MDQGLHDLRVRPLFAVRPRACAVQRRLCISYGLLCSRICASEKLLFQMPFPRLIACTFEILFAQHDGKQKRRNV